MRVFFYIRSFFTWVVTCETISVGLLSISEDNSSHIWKNMFERQ